MNKPNQARHRRHHIQLLVENAVTNNIVLIQALGLCPIIAAGTTLQNGVALTVCTAVVLVLSWGMVFLTNAQGGISQISTRSWLFLILSGLATGASWLCYYKALQIGDVSKVAPIDKLSVVITIILAAVLLHEQLTFRSVLGCILIAGGTLLMVL